MTTAVAGRFVVEWVDHGRAPREKPDPRHPDGVDLDITEGSSMACRVDLPYPAPRVGVYVAQCEICGLRVGATTAGRVDDPRSITMACRPLARA